MKTLSRATLLVVMLFLISTLTIADTTNPTPTPTVTTKTVDQPSGYTERGFRLYETGDYPSSDSLNQNLMDIDREIGDSQTLPLLVSIMAFLVSLIALALAYRSRT